MSKNTRIPTPPEISPVVREKAGRTLHGQPLKPYSASRKVAAQRMGLLFPMVGPKSFEQWKNTGAYPGLVLDVCIVLWLCSQKDILDLSEQEARDGVWTPSKALQEPYKAQETAIEWGGQLGILDLLTEKGKEAAELFFDIVGSAEGAKFTAKTDKSGDDPDRL